MDQDFVEKIRLTRFGFRLKLIGFSTFLSWFGIVTSLLVIIGGITVLSIFFSYLQSIIIIPIVFISLLLILYLVMWIFLYKKTNRRNINGIETLAKVYGYVIGTLEIIGTIVSIIVISAAIEAIRVMRNECVNYPWENCSSPPPEVIAIAVGKLIFVTVYLIMACLKIHGIRLLKNKLLGIYLCFRYVILIIHPILEIASMIKSDDMFYVMFAIGWLIIFALFTILDLGLINILYGIREDRKKVELFQKMTNDV